MLAVALLTGVAGSASAKPQSDPLKGLKAITAMDSKRSEIRREPDRKSDAGKARVSTNVKSLGATTAAGTPTQNMGNPADKTVFAQDKLSIAKTYDGQGVGGNATTQQATALNDTMAGIDGSKTTADVQEANRAIIDHQYPSKGGRFVNGKQESTLAFREQVAGTDALWTLGTVNQAAEQYPMGDPVTDPAVGTTYAITQAGVAITNTGAQQSQSTGAQISSTPVGVPDAAQQWAVVASSYGNGTQYVQLVSRADGLCLGFDEDTLNVDVAVCAPTVGMSWRLNTDGTNVSIVPVFNGAVVSSSTQQGAAGSLVLQSTTQTWQFQPINEPGGAVPTWSTPRNGGFTNGNISAPYDMAVGDLDGAVGSDGLYHDEAVVVYTDSNDNWALRVVDYNANSSHLLVSSPASAIPFDKNGSTSNGKWYSGSLIVQVGDFKGDGNNEILAGFQDNAGDLTLSFWRYTADSDGSRHLDLVNQSNCNSCDGQPFRGSGPAQTLVTGYTDTAVGDFDGDGAADLAVAFATSPETPFDSTELTPSLGVVTFDSHLAIRSTEVTRTGIAGKAYLPPAVNDDPTRTGSGLRLTAGVFDLDPTTGFGYQRRELAMSWVATFDKGGFIVDGNTQIEVYGRQPQFQMYAVKDSACPLTSTFSVCTSTAALSSAQPNLASPFPNNPITYDMVPAGQPHPDVAPLAMAAGAYGGAGAGDPPVWGVWFMQWQPNYDINSGDTAIPHQVSIGWVVPWTSSSAPSTPVFHENVVDATDQPNYFSVTAYDRFGDSLVLGSPVVFDIDNSKTLDMLAAEPPKHADYLNGAMSKAALSSGYYLSTTSTSKTEWSSSVSNQNAYSNGGSTANSAKATLAAGLGPFDEKSSLALQDSFKAAWTGSNTTSTDTTGSKSLSISSNAVDDDVIWASLHDYQVYRYPVFGTLANGTTCGGNPCNPYYEVTIPGTTTFMPESGLADSDYNPTWQNNNALSYPAINRNTGAVPLPDQGTYSYQASGSTQTSDAPLYNQGNQLGGSSSSVNLTLNSATGGGSTITSGHGWENDAQITASASVTVGVPKVDGGTIDFSTTDGVQNSKTFANTTVTSNKTTTGTEFVLNTASIPSSEGFEVGSAVYFSTAGTPKVIHGVDLTNTAYGTYFTSANTYGTNSDVALNLPGRISIELDSDDNPQAPWMSTSVDRQRVRGFQMLQVESNPLLPTAGTPFSTVPTSGTQVQFAVPVSNLSLVAMPSATTAHFWAVPVNALNNAVTGARIDLGSAPVPALGAQGTETVTSPIWATPSVTDAQRYRIFVVLDEQATMPEIHPLQSSACPSGVVDPDDPASSLYDLMSQNATAPDPTGCGQNNQGYGLITVAPVTVADHAGSPANPANVTLDGAGLLDGIAAHQKLGTNSPVPIAPLNANLRGVVYAKADRQSRDNQPFIVYDGKPSDDKVIYSGRMSGVSASSGGAMTFTWKPTEPGLHELHTVILGSSTAGQDDEQIFRVWVDSKPITKPFTVTATADKATVEAGGTITVSGRVTPALSTADERDIALQVSAGDAWTTVLEKDTAADGSYSFTVPEPKTGSYTYRVKKYAAGGRSAAYSPQLNIRVITGFVITAKASPAAVDLGKSTTISGTVAPPQSSAGNRKVHLQVRSGSSWVTVANGTTTAAGGYRFTVRPKAQGTFTYRVLKAATTDLKAASSPTVRIVVTQQFGVTARAKPATIRLGKTGTIFGLVTPKLVSGKDRVVQLQLRKGSTWRKVSSTRTAASGAYSFTVKPTKQGSYNYRVLKTAAERKRSAVSPTVNLKVNGHR